VDLYFRLLDRLLQNVDGIVVKGGVARMRALAIKKRDALQKTYPELAPPNGDGLPALNLTVASRTR
jgi:hypothetical protein